MKGYRRDDRQVRVSVFSFLYMANQKTIVRPPLTPEDIILVAGMVQRMRSGGDLRNPLIRRIRKAIESAEYENSLKLDIAAERVLDRLGMS